MHKQSENRLSRAAAAQADTAPAVRTSSRGRGRPRANGSVSANARDDILRAAARLMSSKGIDGTRISDIAAAVGVRPPSIYYHFKDMEEILRTLADFTVFDASPYARRLRAGDSPSECLRALIHDQIARLNESDMDVWFITETAQLNRYDFPEVAQKVQVWQRSVAKIYEAGWNQGEFADMDKDVAVAAIAGITFGAYRYVHGGGHVDPDVLAAVCVRALGGRVD